MSANDNLQLVRQKNLLENQPTLIFRLMAPIRALLKRGSPGFIKRAVWNSEFKRGHFLHDNLHKGYRSQICEKIEYYCRGGDILDLGCSDGHVGLGLKISEYSSYLGVDISEIAVKSAYEKLKAYGDERNGKNNFVVHDICNYKPKKKIDVIVFKDSFYYINKLQQLPVLYEYHTFLNPAGVFIVQMDNIARHGWIRDVIRVNFSILEDEESTENDYMRIIFRNKK
jgi:SAM-dependent methyltransferase